MPTQKKEAPENEKLLARRFTKVRAAARAGGLTNEQTTLLESVPGCVLVDTVSPIGNSEGSGSSGGTEASCVM